MKNIITSTLLVMLLTGCISIGEEGQNFTLIWRESSGLPIEQVSTPTNFKISPADAVKPIMARMSRAPWAEFYLFADTTNYYFGNTRKGTELRAPEEGHWMINGASGKTTLSKKKNTEPEDGIDE